MSLRDAFAELTQRANLNGGAVHPSPPALAPRRTERVPRPLDPAVVDYVEACAQTLWKREGRPVLDWLVRERALDPEILAMNKVGADLGPTFLLRAYGLPRGGLAAVFPALDAGGEIAYAQTRYLQPSGRSKYENPAARLGDNPRVAHVRPAFPADADVLVVCEGLPDAYTVAEFRLPAVAVLGATYPDQRVADAIRKTAGDRPIIIAFDNDAAGNGAAERLSQLLAPAVSAARLLAPSHLVDINNWRRAEPTTFADVMRTHGTSPLAVEPVGPTIAIGGP